MTAENNDRMHKKLRVAHYFIFAAVALLIAAVITLSVFLGITVSDRNTLGLRSENAYASAYYTLTDSLLQID